MQLPTVQDGWYEVPDPLAGRFLCSTDRCRHHPSIDRMTLEKLFRLAVRLLETIALSQFFGLPPFFEMNQ
jgi:hypothetical protein